MKTFKDLVFKEHPISKEGIGDRFKNHKMAEMDFPNGYGISVIFGNMFYSNGKDTYEVAVLSNGKLCYDSGIADDVVGHCSEIEVTELMEKIQLL